MQYSPTCAGIGDFLRAAGYLYNYCKVRNIQFYINITNPIHSFFEYKRHDGDTSQFVKAHFRNGTNKEFTYSEILALEDNCIIQTNEVPDWTNLDAHVKSLHDQGLLVPTAAITTKFASLLEQYQLEKNKYYCIHIRFGDNLLRGTNWDDRVGRSQLSVQERLEKCISSIENKDLPIVLITDDYDAKVQIAKQYGLRYLDIKPVHTSFTTDIAAVEQSVLEFLTLGSALKVYAVSRSGFSAWAAAYGGKECVLMQ